MILIFGIAVWGVTFGGLELWAQNFPWDVRHFAFNVWDSLQPEFSHWFLENIGNFEQFIHVLLFVIAFASGLIAEVFIIVGFGLARLGLRQF